MLFMWCLAQLFNSVESETKINPSVPLNADMLPLRIDCREHDHIASDLFNIHESDREMKPDVYVSKAAHVEGFPKSFEKIGGTISGQNRLSLTNIYYYVEKLNCIIVLI